MNIGCDLDGVIIDHSYNQALMLAERGFIIPRNNISKKILQTLLTPEEYIHLKKELYEARSISAQEIKGAIHMLQKIISDGHDIRIISRRDMASSHALEWLNTHGILSIIPTSSIHFVSTYAAKEHICKTYNIELHIDDSPEVFEYLHTPRHHILFDPYRHHQRNKSLITVQSWKEIYDYLTPFSS